MLGWVKPGSSFTNGKKKETDAYGNICLGVFDIGIVIKRGFQVGKVDSLAKRKGGGGGEMKKKL